KRAHSGIGIRLRKSAEERARNAREKTARQALYVLQHKPLIGRMSEKFFHGRFIPAFCSLGNRSGQSAWSALAGRCFRASLTSIWRSTARTTVPRTQDKSAIVQRPSPAESPVAAASHIPAPVVRPCT